MYVQISKLNFMEIGIDSFASANADSNRTIANLNKEFRGNEDAMIVFFLIEMIGF